MQKSKTDASGWTATHRYDDVYECSKDDITLSHSIKGLRAAALNLEENGDDFALKQLETVNAKLEAIEKAGPAPSPAEDVEANA